MNKFCKDCKHYDPTEITHWCARDVTQVLCLVTGEMKNTSTYKFCVQERGSRSRLLGIETGYCGKEGVYFESKHQPKTSFEEAIAKARLAAEALGRSVEEYNKFVED